MYEGDGPRGSEWSNRTGTEKPVRIRERGISGIEFGTPRLSTNRDRTPGSEITGKFASATDPEVGLYNKDDGEPARLCSINQALMENHSGLAVDGSITEASDKAEGEAGLLTVRRRTDRCRITIGADKARNMRSSPRFSADDRSRCTLPSTGISGRPASRVRPS